MSINNSPLDQLRDFLNKLFQFETQDLDFGVYKILRYKREEIKQFIDDLLVNTVKIQLQTLTGKQVQDWENIILITPNEGLSRQHYEEFIQSGIGAAIYSGSEESLKTLDGEVLIIEITKLTTNKSGEGVSVDVDYFSESKNLVFIDEGHKGQRSEEKAWKKLREHITRGEGSFTFEYSATFGQIISSGDSDLLREYGRSIIFDYSYRHFYTDGYGKDFAVFNIDAQNDYSEIQNRLLLTAGLLGFYEQLALFEEYREELRIYNIEKPLWIFVGSKVIGSGSKTLSLADRQNISDVSHIYFL